ncbi:MAG TPA: coenzyme F420-0:L-glutamate ligase [Chthonomonadaceae bacterium]|nr:coenzyme F420-0:L-glutamate ligase [Chthonomonadaceae bacterium]
MPPQPSIKQIDSRTFTRIPVQTHKVMFGEDLAGVIAKYAADQLHSSDILCLSEKFVTICQNNVRHISTVKDSWLARLIVRYVTKYPNDIGYSHPKKMQVAIDLVGYPRMMLAVVGGGLSKLLLRRRGDFYRIAGHRISEIDGFNPEAMKPFDEYAMLPPLQPDATCDAISEQFGCGCYIIDGNNINVEVIGMSRNLAALGIDKTLARTLMLDNPMGQHDELTPIYILRETPEWALREQEQTPSAPYVEAS